MVDSKGRPDLPVGYYYHSSTQLIIDPKGQQLPARQVLRGGKIKMIQQIPGGGEWITTPMPGQFGSGSVPKSGPPKEKEPEPEEEECFKFVNVFRMRGSTAPGADPQVKVLVSSGKISCKNIEILEASGNIIEEIKEKDVSPPGVVVTPQNPFYRKNGQKVQITENKDGPGRTLRIEIKESLGFREIG